MIMLYDYFRSSAAYRIRIALHLKGLAYKSIKIDLLKGKQLSEDYRKINPQGVIPYYVDGDVEISQSLAIMEYLDARYPETLLVFGTDEEKAYIRQLSLGIAADTHQFSHPKVWKGYLVEKLGLSEAQGKEWLHHWVHNGLRAYEAALEKYGRAGDFSCGGRPSMADLCLIPQLHSARRNGLDLSAYPRLLRIERNCVALKAFQDAAPESHPDAPDGLEQIHGPRSPLLAHKAT